MRFVASANNNANLIYWHWCFFRATLLIRVDEPFLSFRLVLTAQDQESWDLNGFLEHFDFPSISEAIKEIVFVFFVPEMLRGGVEKRATGWWFYNVIYIYMCV